MILKACWSDVPQEYIECRLRSNLVKLFVRRLARDIRIDELKAALQREKMFKLTERDEVIALLSMLEDRPNQVPRTPQRAVGDGIVIERRHGVLEGTIISSEGVVPKDERCLLTLAPACLQLAPEFLF